MAQATQLIYLKKAEKDLCDSFTAFEFENALLSFSTLGNLLSKIERLNIYYLDSQTQNETKRRKLKFKCCKKTTNFTRHLSILKTGCGTYPNIVKVIDGSPSLIEEMREIQAELQAYITEKLSPLLKNEDFLSVLQAYLPGDSASHSRSPLLERKLNELAKLVGCKHVSKTRFFEHLAINV